MQPRTVACLTLARTVLTRCGLVLPLYGLADEKPRPCLPDNVERPTSVRGRVLWPLGSTKEASTGALTQAEQAFQGAAVDQEPTSRVRGMLTDGCDRTTQRMRLRFPGARLGPCLRHALNTLPRKLTVIASPLRKR
jgi:hypothetical protein